LGPITAFGLDVAASQYGDTTVLAPGNAKGVRCLHQRQRTDQGDNPADTMQTVAWVILTARQQHGIELTQGYIPICVDTDGVGKGVADRLLELGCNVIYFRGNDRPDDPKRYFNRRAEAYGELARRLDPQGPFMGMPFALPPDEFLREELCAPEKIYSSDAFKFRITPKRLQPGMSEDTLTVTAKLDGRSPDRADAVVYLYEALRRAVRRAPPQIHRDIAWSLPHDPGADDEDWARPYTERLGIVEYDDPALDIDDALYEDDGSLDS
jgi:hypothetical protein